MGYGTNGHADVEAVIKVSKVLASELPPPGGTAYSVGLSLADALFGADESNPTDQLISQMKSSVTQIENYISDEIKRDDIKKYTNTINQYAQWYSENLNGYTVDITSQEAIASIYLVLPTIINHCEPQDGNLRWAVNGLYSDFQGDDEITQILLQGVSLYLAALKWRLHFYAVLNQLYKDKPPTNTPQHPSNDDVVAQLYHELIDQIYGTGNEGDRGWWCNISNHVATVRKNRMNQLYAPFRAEATNANLRGWTWYDAQVSTNVNKHMAYDTPDGGGWDGMHEHKEDADNAYNLYYSFVFNAMIEYQNNIMLLIDEWKWSVDKLKNNFINGFPPQS